MSEKLVVETGYILETEKYGNVPHWELLPNNG
jgi:hypothetical protein